MFANFLIGLREGLEASLVVGILIAYLVKTGNRDKLRPVWGGIAAAIALSVAFGALLTYTSTEVLSTGKQQETFAGVVSLAAIGFVTWMIFWMRRTARFLKTDLQDKLTSALAIGGLALAVTSFLAVGREGLETALFLWSAIQSTSEPVQSTSSAFGGLLTAALLGWAFYRGALNLNLKTFFTWTGAALVIVAAGVCSYGIHDLQEAGTLPGLSTLAFDVSNAIPPSSWYGTLLKGVFNFNPTTTVLQAVAWVAYVVPVLFLFLRPSRTPVAPEPAPQRVNA